MGLFGKKEICCICGIEKGNIKILDGSVCQSCIEKSGGFLNFGEKFKDVSKNRVLQCIEENKKNLELAQKFQPTKKIDNYLWIDENKKLWIVPNEIKNPVVFSYNDIIKYDILKNGKSVLSGGVGSTIVGGALFGSTGAIVGANIGKKTTNEVITTLIMKITTRNKKMPTEFIYFISEAKGNVKNNTTRYNYLELEIEKVKSAFDIIISETSEAKEVRLQSSADEIIKYKKLLDDGIITQEEFKTKKKQLLGL